MFCFICTWNHTIIDVFLWLLVRSYSVLSNSETNSVVEVVYQNIDETLPPTRPLSLFLAFAAAGHLAVIVHIDAIAIRYHQTASADADA